MKEKTETEYRTEVAPAPAPVRAPAAPPAPVIKAPTSKGIVLTAPTPELSSLKAAIEADNENQVRQIITAKPSLMNTCSPEFLYPFLYSAKMGKLKATKVFLEKGVDITCVDSKQKNCLHLVAQLSSADISKAIADLLLANENVRSKIINQVDEMHLTPLIAAIKNKNIELAIALIKIPECDLNVADKDGVTALMFACKHKFKTVVTDLLASGRVDVNLQCKAKNSSLHIAVGVTVKEIVSALIEKGADPSLKNADGQLPADLAKSNEIKDILKPAVNVLIRRSAVSVDEEAGPVKGPDVVALEKSTKSTKRPVSSRKSEPLKRLFQAIDNGNLEQVKQMLAAEEVQINEVSSSNENALFYAFKKEKKDIAEYLFRENADTTVVAKNGKTCLHYLAKTNWKDLAEKMLGGDAVMVINERDENGNTPLMVAVENGQASIAKLFAIQDNCDVNIGDDKVSH